MSANDTQIGGKHYGGSDYQHWDYAHDAKLGYLEGVASKYVARWRTAGKGRQDLEKAIHYVEKAEEVHALGAESPFWRNYLERFKNSSRVELEDYEAIFYISMADWPRARACLEAMLSTLAQTVE